MNDYLVLHQVTKRFGDKTAVDRLDLNIPRGSIYGIIGPNGAGKTTTIRMMMNIIVPDSGQVLLDGHPIDESFKNLVGYLPEERGLYKKMILREVALYLGRLKGASKKEILDRLDGWLERMDLLEYRNRKVEELSKGMQQKLQFVTTLIHEPDIIILDELFSGLDPLNIEIIKNIILELKRDGRTILFSTHVMEQAEKLCDYVCMIANGSKVLDGTMADVRRQYGRDTIQVEIDGDGSFLKSLPGVTAVTEYTNYFELTIGEEADTRSLIRQIVSGADVIRLEQIRPSLYNIFINLAGKRDGSGKEAGGGHE